MPECVFFLENKYTKKLLWIYSDHVHLVFYCVFSAEREILKHDFATFYVWVVPHLSVEAAWEKIWSK